MDNLAADFAALAIDEYEIIKIIKIQKWFRGCILRLKQLPLIMYKIKNYLKLQTFQFSKQNKDGRINSCFDEEKIIELLIQRFKEKIKKTQN